MEIEMSPIPRFVWCGGTEPDWPGALDLEPETCFCLRCGDELPCSCPTNSLNPMEMPCNV
jgi:hypothetical protein